MTTKQIKIGSDCVKIIEEWKHEQESMSDAIRRIDRRLKKHKEKL